MCLHLPLPVYPLLLILSNSENTCDWLYLELVALVCVELGWTSIQVSAETIRQTLLRLKINWKRAKHWITSPDPQYQVKKTHVTA